MPKSYTLDNQVINYFTRTQAVVAPSEVWLGLFTVSPGAGGVGGTEVSGGSYARVSVTNPTILFGAPVNGVSTNTADIQFATATAGWGTVVAFGLFDALSGGNVLYFASLGTSRAVLNGDTAKLTTGTVTITETLEVCF
jgi:hypothetical protein